MNKDKEKLSIFAWAKKIWPILTVAAFLLSGAGAGARLWADQYYSTKEALSSFEARVEDKYVSKEVFQIAIQSFDEKLDMMIAILKEEIR